MTSRSLSLEARLAEVEVRTMRLEDKAVVLMLGVIELQRKKRTLRTTIIKR